MNSNQCTKRKPQHLKKKILICRWKKNLKSFFSKRKKKKAIEMWIQNSNRSQTEKWKKCVKIYRKYLCEKKTSLLRYKIFGVSPNELNFSFNSPSCDIQQRSWSNHINHLFSHSRMWIHPTFFPSSFLLLHEFSSYFLP